MQTGKYSPETERERRKLRPILRKAKQIPKYKMKSKLSGDKLIINSKTYTSKTLHLLPEPLTGYSVTKKESDSHIGFFGELNPLSNFHTAFFTVDGIRFHSSEQFIQYQKAKLFKDDSAMKKTLECSTPLECKKSSKEIDNFDPDIWKEKAGELCEEGIKAKFTQNPVLLKLLDATGTKHLVECAYDKTWGNGIPLHEDNCLDDTAWSGENLLGEILMRIRSANRDIIGDNEASAMDT